MMEVVDENMGIGIFRYFNSEVLDIIVITVNVELLSCVLVLFEALIYGRIYIFSIYSIVNRVCVVRYLVFFNLSLGLMSLCAMLS